MQPTTEQVPAELVNSSVTDQLETVAAEEMQIKPAATKESQPENDVQKAPQPIIELLNDGQCEAGCGFFGMCSLCFKKSGKKLPEPKKEKPEKEPEKKQEEESEAMKKKRKKRCEKCNKKLKFVFEDCSCGGKFCYLHLHDHQCTFDCKKLKNMSRIEKKIQIDVKY